MNLRLQCEVRDFEPDHLVLLREHHHIVSLNLIHVHNEGVVGHFGLSNGPCRYLNHSLWNNLIHSGSLIQPHWLRW